MLRLTTIPFSFSLAGTTEGYQITKVLPTPYRIVHLYIHGEPSPNQLLYVQLFKWPNQNPPASGIPGGATVFDDLIQAPQLRVGRIPIDIDLDIPISGYPLLLCYANNGSATQQQCDVAVTVVLP